MGKKKSLKNMVYESIYKDIVKGVYADGGILNEKVLVEKYGVSKSPVRDALIELCNDGILNSIPRYGYEIVKLTHKNLMDILHFRVILEGGVFREIVNNITTEQIEELEKANALCTSEASLKDFQLHWKYNREFHLKLMSFSDNQVCYDILEKQLNVLTRAYAQFYWDKWSNIKYPMDTKAHKSMIECLKKGDLEGSIHFLKEDIDDFGGM